MTFSGLGHAVNHAGVPLLNVSQLGQSWGFILGVALGAAFAARATEAWWFLVNRTFPRQRRHKPHLGCCRAPVLVRVRRNPLIRAYRELFADIWHLLDTGQLRPRRLAKPRKAPGKPGAFRRLRCHGRRSARS